MKDLSIETLTYALEALKNQLPPLEEERGGVVDEQKKLNERRKGLDEQILKIKDGIKEISASLQGGPPPVELNTQLRQKEKALIVQEFYKAHPNSGFTIPEIMKATDLAHGTVHGIMSRTSSGYQQDEQNRWWPRDNDVQAPSSSASSPHSPSLARRPEYAAMSIILSIQKVMESQGGTHSADSLSRIFYFIETPEQLEKAKRTVSSELSRGVRQGFWYKIGKNIYGPMESGKMLSFVNSVPGIAQPALSPAAFSMRELCDLAFAAMQEEEDPQAIVPYDDICRKIENKGRVLTQHEKESLLQELHRLADIEESRIYESLEADCFGLEPKREEETDDVESRTATP